MLFIANPDIHIRFHAPRESVVTAECSVFSIKLSRSNPLPLQLIPILKRSGFIFSYNCVK